MRLSDLISPTVWDGDDPHISGLTSDSRAVKPGMMFAAIPGTVADGRDYIEAAIKNGAAAILSTAIPPKGRDISVPYIGDKNPRLRYSQFAAKLHAEQPDTLVAMTGTNGKSSTVEFLRQIWAFAGHKAACFGTIGITSPAGYKPLTHTTPDAVALHQTLSELAAEGVSHVGMEASSHGLKQYRLDGVDIRAAGYSNLTQDHFDYHPDIEDYFASKARLFTELTPPDAPVVITVDDPYGRELAEMCTARGQDVMRVGWGGEDISILEITPRAVSQVLDLRIQGTRHRVELPLAGEFQVFNAVTAVGLALVTDVDVDTALEGLAGLKGVSGRMEPVGRGPNGAPVFVDFAHTEDGLNKLLRGLRPHTQGQIRLVFGCGGDRDPDKRAKMGATAAALADDVIVTDDNPRTEVPAAIRAQVMTGCPKATEIGDRSAAIAEGVSRLEPKDCLVVAGKGHEQGQIVGTDVLPFSDQKEVRKALRALEAQSLVLWTAQDAAVATQGDAQGEWAVSGLSIDTRSLKAGDLFIPLKDIRDGHDFIPAARAAGAGAVMSEHPDEKAPALRVTDSLQALRDMAVAARERSAAHRIAITGSVGKTSLKAAIACITASVGLTHSSQKSFNNHWGVPFTLASMPKATQYGVFEVGMNHAGELADLSPIIAPHIAVISKIAPAHLAHFENIDAIAAAKAEIFQGLARDGLAVLPRDDPFFDFLATSARSKGAQIVSFGQDIRSDIHLTKVTPTQTGSDIELMIKGQSYALSLAIAGAHWAENAACALAVSTASNIEPSIAIAALSELKPLAGRGEVFQVELAGKTLTIIDDSYNANPESMRAAIATLGLYPGRKLAVLGDMYELGRDELALHAALSAPVEAASITRVFMKGECMRALRGALPHALRGPLVATIDEAYDALCTDAEDGDVVLVKGSNASGLGALITQLKAKDTRHAL